MRPALKAGEDRSVDLLCKLSLAEDESATRTAQRLMRRGRHHVETGIQRIAHHIGRDQSANMRDIRHGKRAHFVCHTLEIGIVIIARIGGIAADNHLRLRRARHCA